MKTIDSRFLEDLSSAAKTNPRRRQHHNLHDTLDEPCQRLLIAMEPGSYLQPHRHQLFPKPELFIALRGMIAVLLFSDTGDVTNAYALSYTGGILGFEVPPGVWHTAVSLEEGSSFLEVKPSPFKPIPAEDKAPWAPAEGAPGSGGYLETISAQARSLCGI